MQFTDINETLTINGCRISITIEQDCNHGAPWDNEDGHGPVSDWTTRWKNPGELLLHRDGSSRRFYDFAQACKIARREEWGIAPYSVTSEQGANGLIRLTGHWFDQWRNIECVVTDWHDCRNQAYMQLYKLHRASMTRREYAARAAMADFERLRDWCNNEWQYVGVIVTATNSDGDEIANASLWGIESDASEHLLEVANELLRDIVPDLPSHRTMLAADIGISE